jgi:hypothetical protein
MIRPRLLFLSPLLVVGALWTCSAFAQTTSYYPSRGPISPWMNMWINKPGPLGNYQSYVRPELQLQKTVAQQNGALMQNAQGLQLLGQQMENSQREFQVRPTGTASVFMEFSHYYPAKGGHATAGPPAAGHVAAPSHGSKMPAIRR